MRRDIISAPRRATPADAEELTRLREVMLVALGVDVDVDVDATGVDWRFACVADLRLRLADGSDAVAFVVDQVPGVRGRLAASGIGFVRHELPGPVRLDGRVGYVLSVCTDEEFRGRGYATAIMTRLLEWYRAEGIAKVDLHASPFGIEIYRRLGFVEPVHPELSWRAPVPAPVSPR